MLVGELKSKLLLAEWNGKVALELRTISQLLLTLLKFKNMKEDKRLLSVGQPKTQREKVT